MMLISIFHMENPLNINALINNLSIYGVIRQMAIPGSISLCRVADRFNVSFQNLWAQQQAVSVANYTIINPFKMLFDEFPMTLWNGMVFVKDDLLLLNPMNQIWTTIYTFPDHFVLLAYFGKNLLSTDFPLYQPSRQSTTEFPLDMISTSVKQQAAFGFKDNWRITTRFEI